MKRKFKIMYHQIEQLKEEIKEKESALIKEHFEHNGQQKKMQQMKDKLERLKKKQQALRQLRASQDSEIRKLETTIMEAEGKRQVYELQRELLQERTKVKALSEELENPMNVHR